ncbi:uncharacterized protein si:zfos-911d5.4 [Acipenser ruthenus]|uniref:uncharacterized protein si:zfos-911d5.4 n=1 Tax=Acipenser ruthenus TaxID=7906 RepID=UPI00274077E3|nr:uncharacterized protein si:zfos-911d5.4 [Acipenser ruthenus]XP_033886641.3 uncharacterized protein si:zfos-911d5.4 [Acipenser ruthenus]
MLKLGSQLIQFYHASASGQAEFGKQEENVQELQCFKDFLTKLRKHGGLQKEAIFCNLRVPNQFQIGKEDIDLVLLTGRGVFCLDVKTWKGKVSVQEHSWHLNFTEETEHFSNTSISQVADPIQVIKTKTKNLWNHLMRSGVCVRQSLFLSRVVFLNPDCHMDPELQKSKEVVAHCDLDSFISSFKEGYLAWISDAVTPYLLSGHLSYRQLSDLSSVLQRTGTWDTVNLHGGQQLKGDYRGCQHIALNREETDQLEFTHQWNMSAGYLWAFLGYSPQVTVKMYRRGGQGWLWKPLSGTAIIPYNTHIVFRVCGEEADAKIPAKHIDTICLSI